MTQIWQNVNIGGGGFVTGIDIANDGTQVIRCDVYGCYVNSPGNVTWRQMQTGTAFGSQTTQAGPYEVAIGKSDSTRIYILAADGFLYKSTDTGHTFSKVTALNSGAALSGDYGGNRNDDGVVFASRFNGRYMAVDPHDPNVLYVCSQTNGVFLTLDGGTTWQTISGIPAATTSSSISLGTFVAIDPAATAVNGRSPNVYIMAYGSQMLKCSNGGSATPTFSASSSGPTTICGMAVDSDGTVVYVADGSTNFAGPGGAFSGTVWQYTVGSNTWADLTLGSSHIHAIAPDPATAGRVVFSDDAAGLYVSTTHGSSPTALALGTKTFTDAPWQALTPNTLYTGDAKINPSTGKLALTEGIGVVTSTPGNSGTVNWTSQTAGIEELVMNFISWSPSYTYPLVGSWDRPLFSIVDPTTPPATQYPNNLRAITMGWSGDFAKSAPGTQVAIVNFDGSGDDSGVTTDRLTWTPFATKPNKPKLVTSASTAVGNGTFTFSSVPTLIAPSSIGGNRQVNYLGFAATTTSISLAGSRVLHFGGGLSASISTNAVVQSPSNPNYVAHDTNLTNNYLGVTGDVQLDGGPNIDVPIGTVIYFANPKLGINGNNIISATTATTFTLTGDPSGQPVWAVGTTYAAGANVAGSDGFVYVSVGSGNVGHDPTTDGGVHWTNSGWKNSILAGETLEITSGKAGCIAASTPNNIIWVGANDEPFPWYTKDGGATWANVVVATSVGGFGAAGNAIADVEGNGTGWGHTYTSNAICVAADSVTANRFLIYNGRQTAAEGAGLWETLDSGDTWTQRVSGRIGGSFNEYQARIVGVAGNAHHFFLSGCAFVINRNNPLMWSSDSTNATWSQIANLANVRAFGLGAAAPGKNYPTLYVVWGKGGVAGIWQGVGNLSDWQAGTNTGTTVTWTNLNGTFGPNALDWLDSASFVEGDPNVFGRVMVARGHSGVAMSSLSAGALSNVFGFSVIHDRGHRNTKMIGY